MKGTAHTQHEAFCEAPWIFSHVTETQQVAPEPREAGVARRRQLQAALREGPWTHPAHQVKERDTRKGGEELLWA